MSAAKSPLLTRLDTSQCTAHYCVVVPLACRPPMTAFAYREIALRIVSLGLALLAPVSLETRRLAWDVTSSVRTDTSQRPPWHHVLQQRGRIDRELCAVR